MTIPEPGRQAAHILLDTVSVFDPEDESANAMNLALARLNEVSAVTATFNDETEEVNLDASNLLGGAALVIERLLKLYGDASGVAKHDAIVELREFLDAQSSGP